jgi:hypothetical protein
MNPVYPTCQGACGLSFSERFSHSQPYRNTQLQFKMQHSFESTDDCRFDVFHSVN